jgi:hypothetical protein
MMFIFNPRSIDIKNNDNNEILLDLIFIGIKFLNKITVSNTIYVGNK